MPQGEFIAGWYLPLEGNLPPMPGYPPAGGIGGKPPLTKPPLPPGVVAPPIEIPPDGGTPEYPIEIPSTPEHPIALPPGTIYPPLGPGEGVQGKALLLVIIPGAVKKGHWIVVDVPPMPGIPQPK